jgi:tetratricopeptide (TPR) repeat protein
MAQGLTPKYAAPELLGGEPLTVRAEVYALGATLAEALSYRGAELTDEVSTGLQRVAARATQSAASARWPSVDELASALRRAARLAPPERADEPPWPVLGLDGASQALLDVVAALEPGRAVAVEGPSGSGRTTLARRLAWTLGAKGRPVALIEAPKSGIPMREAVELELAQHAKQMSKPAKRPGPPLVIVVDDAELLDNPARDALQRAARSGARLVAVAPVGTLDGIPEGCPVTFTVPPLETDAAVELLHRSVPSLPDALGEHLLDRVGRRPGVLRAAVRKLAGRAVVSKEDIDAALSGSAPPSSRSLASGRETQFEQAERALDRGRLDEASTLLAALAPARGEIEQVRVGLAQARIAIGRGEANRALAELDAVEASASAMKRQRAWHTLRARASLRGGQYADAVRLADTVVSADSSDAHAADALSVRGVALAFTGDDVGARTTLEQAIRIARSLGEPRLEAVALGSSAIAHQRAGQSNEARAAYEASLAAAERAEDAATVATTRLNLAGLAQTEGDLAKALVHLEAAVDMGRRAGIGAAVTQALLNLANLDLYLGRWARARSSLDQLAASREQLAPAARAQLLGLEAGHAARTGESARAASLYEEAARSWDAQERTHDAAESRLEALLARARARPVGTDHHVLARELEAIHASLGSAGFGEHSALAELVRAAIADAAGNEDVARQALDRAIEAAKQGGHGEWGWQALDARARVASAQGAVATARRDTEAALALLEQTAARLPRDLR